jgi:tryptophan synthase alpha chain
MNRIQKVLTEQIMQKKKSFIGYLTAGDPSIETLEPLLYALEEGGCDLIEIGVPFSDPLADGPTIQAAGQRSIENGTNIYKIFDVLSSCRSNIKVPLAFLVYFNTLTVYGVEAFIKKCEEIGIDGLIIPDLPYEESGELTQFLDQEKLALIPFATPTSKERMAFTLEAGSGFVYTVSSMGVTGRASDFHLDLDAYINDVKTFAKIPVAIGFGISTKEDVARMSKLADAVIVGSAIVTKIHETQGNPLLVKAFIQELVSGLKTV